jgi:hypothetical protein
MVNKMDWNILFNWLYLWNKGAIKSNKKSEKVHLWDIITISERGLAQDRASRSQYKSDKHECSE